MAPQPTRALKRGGVAAGDPANNPTATTFDAYPPSSTYHGPTIAGSEGGFIGLVSGLGLFVIFVSIGVYICLRRRKRTRARARAAAAASASFPSSRGATAGNPSAGTRGWRRAPDADDPGAEESDAFDMPNYPEGQLSTPDFTFDRKQWLNPSTMSLDEQRQQGYDRGSSEALEEEQSFRDGPEANPFSDEHTTEEPRRD